MARCHVADAGAVAPDVIIHDVEEIGGSIARHPYELRRERERLSHPILQSKTKYSYMCAQDVQTHTYITNCNSIKVSTYYIAYLIIK